MAALSLQSAIAVEKHARARLRHRSQLREVFGVDEAEAVVARLAGAEDFARAAQADAQMLLDRDGGLDSERGQAARTCLYLFERDAAVGLLKGG